MHLIFIPDNNDDSILKLSLWTNILSSNSDQNRLLVRSASHKRFKGARLICNRNGETVELLLNGTPVNPISESKNDITAQIVDDVDTIENETEIILSVTDTSALTTLVEALAKLSDEKQAKELISSKEDVNQSSEQGLKYLVTEVNIFNSTRSIIVLTDANIIVQPLSSPSKTNTISTTNISHANKKPWRGINAALEIEYLSNSLFVAFDSTTNRDHFCEELLTKVKPLEALERSTQRWIHTDMSSFDYLLRLNNEAGRTFKDLQQYPIMPWTLLLDKKNATITQENLPDISHTESTLSNPQFIVRLLSVKHPNLLLLFPREQTPSPFSSIEEAWESIKSEPSEAIPQLYEESLLLKDENALSLSLPEWANGDANLFVKTMRDALESDYISSLLPQWIDAVFGVAQKETAQPQDGTLSWEDSTRVLPLTESTPPLQLFTSPHPESAKSRVHIDLNLEQVVKQQEQTIEELKHKDEEHLHQIDLLNTSLEHDKEIIKQKDEEINQVRQEKEQAENQLRDVRKSETLDHNAITIQLEEEIQQLKKQHDEEVQELKRKSEALDAEKSKEIEQLTQEDDQLKHEIEELRQQGNANKVKQEYEKRVAELNESIASLEKEKVELEESVKAEKQTVEEQLKQITWLTKLKSENGAKIEELNSQVEALQTERTHTNDLLAEKKQNITNLEESKTKLESQVEQLTSDLASLKRSEDAKEGEIRILNDEIQAKDQSLVELGEKNTSLRNQLNDAEETRVKFEEEKRTEIESLTIRVSELESYVHELEAIRNQRDGTISQLEETLRQKEQDIETKSKEITEQKDTIEQKESTIKDHETEIETLGNEIVQLKENVQQKEENIQQLTDTVRQRDESISEHVQARDALVQDGEAQTLKFNNEMERLQKVIDTLEDVIKQKESQLKTQRESAEESERKINILENENKNLKTQAQQKQKVVDELQVKLNLETKRNEKFERSKSNLLRNMKESSLHTRTEGESRWSLAMTELEKKYGELQAKHLAMKEEKDELRRQYLEQKKRNDQTESKLQRQIQQMEASIESAMDERDKAIHKEYEAQSLVQELQGENRQLNLSLDILEKKFGHKLHVKEKITSLLDNLEEDLPNAFPYAPDSAITSPRMERSTDDNEKENEILKSPKPRPPSRVVTKKPTTPTAAPKKKEGLAVKSPRLAGVKKNENTKE